MLTGVVLSLAASPPVAAGRLGLEPFYFVNRHILYLIPAIAIMLAVSFLCRARSAGSPSSSSR